MPQRRTAKGTRVAHATIDAKDGLARTGVVEDVIGDDDGALVAARWDDTPDTVEAFDEREIVPLVGPARGPVILRLRHMFALLRRPASALLIAGTVLLGAALAVVSHWKDWQAHTTVLAGAAIAAVMLAAAAALTRRSP